VRVVLLDHCAEEEINTGVNQGQAFQEAFPDEALDDLHELRRTFLEKSFLARQEQLIRRLRQAGLDDAQIVGLAVGDLTPQGEDVCVQCQVSGGLEGPTLVRLAAGDLAKYQRKRVGLGLPAGDGALLFTMLDGTPLAAATLAAYLRRSRTIRVSIALNSSLCEGLLRTRYHPERSADTASVGDILLTAR
jgi:hypothetical protein